MTTIQTGLEIARADGHGLLALTSHSGVAMIPFELAGPASGRQPARRVAMRTLPVAGSRR